MSQLRLDPAAYMTQNELREHMKLLLRLQRQLRLDPDSPGHRKALFEIAFQIYHYCDRIDYSQDDYHHQLKPKVAWRLRLAARDASMMGKKRWNRSLINRLALLRTKPDNSDPYIHLFHDATTDEFAPQDDLDSGWVWDRKRHVYKWREDGDDE